MPQIVRQILGSQAAKNGARDPASPNEIESALTT